MTDTFEITLGMRTTQQYYWVRETAYIVNEMLHAIEQSKNPELTETQRAGYARRATDLRDKAIMCINNAYNDSNNEEEKQ